MFKRIISLTAALCLLFGMCSGMNVYAGDNTDRTAHIEFSKIFETKNITKYRFSSGDYAARIKRDGRDCIRFNADPTTTYLYLDLNDDVFWFPDGVDALVTVDYFDEGKGTFTLRYGSVDEEYCDNAEIVKLENTKTWKSHTFEISNAVFTNKISTGYDIILAEWSKYMSRSPEEVIFGGMTIEYVPVPIKISVDSEEVGNIFSAEEEKALHINVDNIKKQDINVDFDYEVLDENGKSIYSDRVSKHIPQDGLTFDIEAAAQKYGIYTLKGTASCKGEDGEDFSKEFEECFSVVNVFADDEPHNKKLAMSTHYKRYTTDEMMTKATLLLSKSGVGFARSEHYWAVTETTPGVMQLQPFWEMPERLNEKDVETLFILDYGNPLYSPTGENNVIPTEGAYLEAFVRYCKFIATTYKGKIKYYEVWNEPNGNEFNTTGVTPEGYTQLLKRVYTELKAIDPEIQVAGCATVHTHDPYGWIKRVFDAGGYDYMDILSIHHYDRSAGFDKDYWRERATQLRELERQYGPEKPMWCTEIGWTNAVDPTWGVDGSVRPTYSVQTYVMSMAEHLLDKMFWYNFQNDGNSLGPSAHNYGIIKNFEGIDSPWSAQNIYVSFAALNKIIGNAEPEEYIVREDGLSVYKFKRPDGKSVLVVWSEEDNQTIALKTDTQTLTKYDIYSNDMGTINADDGTFLISAERKPSYYVGNFNSFGETTSNISVSTVGAVATDGDRFSLKVEDKLGRNIRIETDSDDEVVKNADGEISVLMSNPKNEEITREMNFYVYADDKLCYSVNQTVKMTEPMKIEVAPKQLSNHRYNATLTVYNQSAEKSISGRASMEIEGADGFEPNSVRFVDIPPRGSQSFDIKMPDMPKASLKNIRTNIELDSGYSFTEANRYDFTFASYCDEKPTVDGILSPGEWTSGWIAADSEYDARYIPTWQGADDISVSANIMWDEKNLYIAAVVKDDVYCQPYTERAVWQGDSVQIGISNIGDEAPDKATFTSLLTALEKGGARLSRYGSAYKEEIGELSNAECEVRYENGYITYEIAVPWSEIFYDEYVPKENTEIGFSFLANDNDETGRKGWIEYTSGIGQTKDYRQFGTLHLVK